METILETALDVVGDDGAAYADVRGVETTAESLSVRGPTVESFNRSDSEGFGVRVLVGGAWGFAASSVLTRDEAVRVARTALEVARASATAIRRPVELVPEPAHDASWATAVERDPFLVPLEERAALLAAATTASEKVDEVRFGRGSIDLLRQVTLFRSSEGSRIEQTITHAGAGIEATAVSDGDVQQRSYPGSFRGHFGGGGYEIVEAMDLAAHGPRIGEEAAALLSAPPCPDTTTTLVLDGHQAMLQLHESVGHPTELDRVLGMEAAFAGTSFVGVPDLGRLRYGSDKVNVTCDATTPGGLGSYAFDDEGVEAQRVDLIRDGLLVGFQSSRETAAALGAERSNGTMRAEGWENFPLIRMPNINLLPGEGSLDDLISEVDDGVLMATNKSWSIDDKRLNFQFGCEIAWEIRKGKLRRMLKDPRYSGMTPAFWSSCDAVAGPEEWKVWGTPNCGKGQPGQTARVGHGTAPCRFRSVSIGMAR